MIVKLKYVFEFLFFAALFSACDSKSEHPTLDTTINGVVLLRNSASIERNFGDLMKKIDLKKDIPDVRIKNQSGTQYLRLAFYPGDNKNVFSLFEVSNNSLGSQNALSSSILNFDTESGIKLGLSKTEVINKKGNNYQESKKGDLIKLRYEIDEKKDKKFLDKYNMPLYVAEYFFKNDVLETFSFGFEYP